MFVAYVGCDRSMLCLKQMWNVIGVCCVCNRYEK